MQKFEFRPVFKALYLIMTDKEDKNREAKVMQVLEDVLEQTGDLPKTAEKAAKGKSDK